MTDDTHDLLMQKVMDYLKASDEFETRPSKNTSRTARRELRELMRLAKARQDEIMDHYNEVLEGFRKDQKWQGRRKHPLI